MKLHRKKKGSGASLVAQMVKNLLQMQDTQVQSLGKKVKAEVKAGVAEMAVYLIIPGVE